MGNRRYNPTYRNQESKHIWTCCFKFRICRGGGSTWILLSGSNFCFTVLKGFERNILYICVMLYVVLELLTIWYTFLTWPNHYDYLTVSEYDSMMIYDCDTMHASFRQSSKICSAIGNLGSLFKHFYSVICRHRCSKPLSYALYVAYLPTFNHEIEGK